MTVVAAAPYRFPVADVRENFPAPLLYIGWDQHLMFCAPFCLPLPPDLPFDALLTQVLPGIYGAHPDFARIDWDQAQWTKAGQPWQPDLDKSLRDNGVTHMSYLSFYQPGLDGINGSGV